MPASELRLIKECGEFIPKSQINKVPNDARGIYTLLSEKRVRGQKRYSVLYVGMAEKGEGIRRRLRRHRRRKQIGKKWSHFSYFQMWDNIREEEIREIEGLIRHMYRKDPDVNSLNTQRSFKKMEKLRSKRFAKI